MKVARVQDNCAPTMYIEDVSFMPTGKARVETTIGQAFPEAGSIFHVNSFFFILKVI